MHEADVVFLARISSGKHLCRTARRFPAGCTDSIASHWKSLNKLGIVDCSVDTDRLVHHYCSYCILLRGSISEEGSISGGT
jgi:hypothetical protein